MTYFPDDRPVSERTFRSHRCAAGVVNEAVTKGFIQSDGTDVDGYTLYKITDEGKKHR